MTQTEPTHRRLVLITGPSGAGRSSAIRVLEDLGFEVIDNMPLRLIRPLLDDPSSTRPLALGIDPRTRDFSVNAVMDAIGQIAAVPGLVPELLYLDCDTDVLLRRFSETRRRPGDQAHLSVSVESFSYKRGLPRSVDMVFDCRFLKNPYWEPSLRAANGTEKAVQDHIATDSRYAEFVAKTTDLALWLLPAFAEEGKSHLSIAFGCTGGQHRSVAIAETCAVALAKAGWQVSIRHRELDRRKKDGAE